MTYALFGFSVLSVTILAISPLTPVSLAFWLLASGCAFTLASFLAYLSRFGLLVSPQILLSYTWIELPGFSSTFGAFLDTSSLLVSSLVLFITLMVLFFSKDYIGSDPAFVRFIAYISLFACSMIFMVLSVDLIQFFFGWELIGLFSYLLVGFWNTRPAANRSALKAVFLNRVGDFCLFSLIVLCASEVGTTSIPALLLLLPVLSDSGVVFIFPYLILFAAAAKSAQYFLHDWLPDAMEGPTPVSSLLHSATMVTAGVFLLIRFNQIFIYFPEFQLFLSGLGAATALFGGLFAFNQFDLKRIVAYSTTANLGLMILACGMGLELVALYHLINHALFKAFLFICSGLFIHATGGRQDLRSSVAGFSAFPFLFGLFTFGFFCSAGFPSSPSFYSKDLLIAFFVSNTFSLTAASALWISILIGLLSFFYSLRPIFHLYSTPLRVPNFPSTFEIPLFGFFSLIGLLAAIILVPDFLEFSFDPALSQTLAASDWRLLSLFQEDWTLAEIAIPSLVLIPLAFLLNSSHRLWLSFPTPRFFNRAWLSSLANPLRFTKLAGFASSASFQFFFNLDRVLLESIGPLGLHRFISRMPILRFSFDEAFLLLFFTILVVLLVDSRVWIWVVIFFIDLSFGSDFDADDRRSIVAITVDCKSINGGSNPPVSFSRWFSSFSRSTGSRLTGFYVTLPASSEAVASFPLASSQVSFVGPGLNSDVLDPDLIGRTTFSPVGGTTFGPSRQSIVSFLGGSVGQPVSSLSTDLFGNGCFAFPTPSGAWFFPGQCLSRSPLLTRWLFRPFISGSLGTSPFCSGFLKGFLRIRLRVRPFLGRSRLSFPFLGSLRNLAGTYLSNLVSQFSPAPFPAVFRASIAISQLTPFLKLFRSRLSKSACRYLGSGFLHGLVFFFSPEVRFGFLRSNLTPTHSRLGFKTIFIGPVFGLGQACRFLRTRSHRLLNRPRAFSFSPFPFVSLSLFGFSRNFIRFGLLSPHRLLPFVFHEPGFEAIRLSPDPRCVRAWSRNRSRFSPAAGFDLRGSKRRGFCSSTRLGLPNPAGFSKARNFSFQPNGWRFNWRFFSFPFTFLKGIFFRILATLIAFFELYLIRRQFLPRGGSTSVDYLYLPLSTPVLENQPGMVSPALTEEIYLRPPRSGWTYSSESEEIFSVPLSNLVQFPAFEGFLPGPQPRRVLPRALGDLNQLSRLKLSPRFYRHGDLETSLPGNENQIASGWDYELGSPFLLWHSFVPGVNHYSFPLGFGGSSTAIRTLVLGYRCLLHLCLPGHCGLPSTFRTSWFSLPVSIVWGRKNFLRIHRLRMILLERAAAKRSFQNFFLGVFSELESNLFLRTRLAIAYLSDGFSRAARSGLLSLIERDLELKASFHYPPSLLSVPALPHHGFWLDTQRRAQPLHRHGIWETQGKRILQSYYTHPSPLGSLPEQIDMLSPKRPFRIPESGDFPLGLWSSAAEFPPTLRVPNASEIRPIAAVSSKTISAFPLALVPDFDPVLTPRVEASISSNPSSNSLALRLSRLGSSLLFENWADKPRLGGGPESDIHFFSRLAKGQLLGGFYRGETIVPFGDEGQRQSFYRASVENVWDLHPIRFLESNWFTYLVHRVKVTNRAYQPPILPGVTTSKFLPAVVDSDPGLDWHPTPLESNPIPPTNPFSRFPNPVAVPVQMFFPRITYQAVVEAWLAFPSEYYFPPRAQGNQSWLNAMRFRSAGGDESNAARTTGRKKMKEKPAEVQDSLQTAIDQFANQPLPRPESQMDSRDQEILNYRWEPSPIERLKALIELDYPTNAAIHDEEQRLLLRTALRPLPTRRDRFWFWRYFRLYEFVAGRLDSYFARLDHRNVGFTSFILQLGYGRGTAFYRYSQFWNTLRYDLALYLSMYTLFPIEDRPSSFQPSVDYDTGHVEPSKENDEPNFLNAPLEFLEFAWRRFDERLYPPLSLFTKYLRSLHWFLFVLIPKHLVSAFFRIQTLPAAGLELFISDAGFRLNSSSSRRTSWTSVFVKKIVSVFPISALAQFPKAKKLTHSFFAWAGKAVGFNFPIPILIQPSKAKQLVRNLRELIWDLIGTPFFPLLRPLVSFGLLKFADWLSTSPWRPFFFALTGGGLISQFGPFIFSTVCFIFSPALILIIPFLDPAFSGFHYLLAGIHSQLALGLAFETVLLQEVSSFVFSQFFLDFTRQFSTTFGLPYQFLHPILIAPVLKGISQVLGLGFLVFGFLFPLKLSLELGSWVILTLTRFLEALAILILPAQLSPISPTNSVLHAQVRLKPALATISPFLFLYDFIPSTNWQRFTTYLNLILNPTIRIPVTLNHSNRLRTYSFPIVSPLSPLGDSFENEADLARSASPARAGEIFTGLISSSSQSEPQYSKSFPYTFSFLLKASWRISSLFAGSHFPKLGPSWDGEHRPWQQWYNNRTRRRPQGIWLVPVSQSSPIRHRPARFITWTYLSHLVHTQIKNIFFEFIRFSPVHLRWLAPTGADLWLRFLRKFVRTEITDPKVSYVSGLRHLQMISDSLFKYLEPAKLTTVDLRSFDWISLATRLLVLSPQRKLLSNIWFKSSSLVRGILKNPGSSHYKYVLPFEKPLFLFPGFGVRGFFKNFRNSPNLPWDFESPSSSPSLASTFNEVFSAPQSQIIALFSLIDSESFEYRSLDWQKLSFHKAKKVFFCRPKLIQTLIQKKDFRKIRASSLRIPSFKNRARKSFEELAAMFTGVNVKDLSQETEESKSESISFLDITRRKKGMGSLREARIDYENENRFRRKSHETHEDGVPVDQNSFRPVSKKKQLDIKTEIPVKFPRFPWSRLYHALTPRQFSFRRQTNRISQNLLANRKTEAQISEYFSNLGIPLSQFWNLFQMIFGGIFWTFKFSLAFVILFFSPLFSGLAISIGFLLPRFLSILVRPVWLFRTWILRIARIPYLIFSWFYFQLSDWWGIWSSMNFTEDRLEDSPFTTFWQTNFTIGSVVGNLVTGIEGHLYLYLQDRTWGFVSFVRGWLLRLRLAYTKFILACLQFRFKLISWLFPISYQGYLAFSLSAKLASYDRFISRYLLALKTLSRVPNNPFKKAQPFYRDLFMAGPELSALMFRLPSGHRPVSFAYELSRFFRLARSYRLILLMGRFEPGEIAPIGLDEAGLSSYRLANWFQLAALVPYAYSKLRTLPFLKRYRRLIRFRDVLKASIPKSSRLFFRLRPVPYLIERTYQSIRRSVGEAIFVNSVSTEEVVPFGLDFDRPGHRFILAEWLFVDKEAWEKAIYIIALIPLLGFTFGLWLIYNLNALPALLHQLIELVPAYVFRTHTLAGLWLFAFILPFFLPYFFKPLYPFGSSPTLYFDRLDRKIALFRFAFDGVSHPGDDEIYAADVPDPAPDPAEDMVVAPFQFYTFDQELVDTYSQLPDFIYRLGTPIPPDDQVFPSDLPFSYQQDSFQRTRGLGRFIELLVTPNYAPKVLHFSFYIFAMQNVPSWLRGPYLHLCELPDTPIDSETEDFMHRFAKEFLFNVRPLVNTEVLETLPGPVRRSHSADWVSSPETFNWRARNLLTAHGTVLRYMNMNPEDGEMEYPFDEFASFSEVRFSGPAWFQLHTAGRLCQPGEERSRLFFHKGSDGADENSFAEIIPETEDTNLYLHHWENQPEDNIDLGYPTETDVTHILDEEGTADLLIDVGLVAFTIYYHLLIPRFTLPISTKHPLSNRSISQLADQVPLKVSNKAIEGSYSTVPRPPVSTRWVDHTLESPGFGLDIDSYHVSPRLRRYDDSVVPYLPPHTDWLTKVQTPAYLWLWPDVRPRHDMPHGKESIYIPSRPRTKTTHKYILTDNRYWGRRPAYLSGLEPSTIASQTMLKTRTDLPRRPILGDLNRIKSDIRGSDSLYTFDTTFQPFRNTLSDTDISGTYLGSVSQLAEFPTRPAVGGGPFPFKAYSRTDKRHIAGHGHSSLTSRPINLEPRSAWPEELQTEFKESYPFLNWGLRDLTLESDKDGKPLVSSSRVGLDAVLSPTPFPEFRKSPEYLPGEPPNTAYFTPNFLTDPDGGEDWTEPVEVMFEEEDEAWATNNQWYRTWTSSLDVPSFKLSPGDYLRIHGELKTYFQVFNKALNSNKRIDWFRLAEFRKRLQAKFDSSQNFYQPALSPMDVQDALDTPFLSPTRKAGTLDTDILRMGQSNEVVYNGFMGPSAISTTNIADEYIPIEMFNQTTYDYANPTVTPMYYEDDEDRFPRGHPNRFWVETRDLEDRGFNAIYEPIASPFNLPAEELYDNPVFLPELMSPYYETALYYPNAAYDDSEVETVTIKNFRPNWPVTGLHRQLSSKWNLKRPYQAWEKGRGLYRVLNPYPHPQRDTLGVWSLPTAKFPLSKLNRRDRLVERWRCGRWNKVFGEQFDAFFPEPEFQKLKPFFIEHFGKHSLVWQELQIGKQTSKNMTRWIAQGLVPGYHIDTSGPLRDRRKFIGVDGQVLQLFPNKLDLRQHLETYFIRLAYMSRVSGAIVENPSMVSPGQLRVDSRSSATMYTRIHVGRDKLNRRIKKRNNFPKQLDKSDFDDSEDHFLTFGKQGIPVNGIGSGRHDMWRIPGWNWRPFTPIEHLLNRIYKAAVFALASLSIRVLPTIYQAIDLSIPTATHVISTMFPSITLSLVLLVSIFLKLVELLTDWLFSWSVEPILWSKFRVSQTFFEEMRPGGSYRNRKVNARPVRYKIPDKDGRLKIWRNLDEYWF